MTELVQVKTNLYKGQSLPDTIVAALERKQESFEKSSQQLPARKKLPVRRESAAIQM